MKIAITGIGVVSAIGNTVEENLSALKAAQTGIDKIQGLKNIRKPYLGGQVTHSNEAIKHILGMNQKKIVPRSALLSLLAAKEAWQNNSEHKGLRTGIISATSIGGMELSEQFYF